MLIGIKKVRKMSVKQGQCTLPHSPEKRFTQSVTINTCGESTPAGNPRSRVCSQISRKQISYNLNVVFNHLKDIGDNFLYVCIHSLLFPYTYVGSA